MNITVFGATGQLGRRITHEALSRGHTITAVARNPDRFGELSAGINCLTGDAADAQQVAGLAAGQDAVISATRPTPGHENELAAVAHSLLAGTTRAGVRLLLVSGAGNLTVPGSDRLAANDPAFVPTAWRSIALACVDQLEVCRADTTADWTALSPPAMLVPGERTGHYRLGADTIVTNREGKSTISMEDFAMALLDETEQPRHRQSRFTVAY